MFLLSLRWQLGEWGFVKREIEIDECYTKMMVGGRVVVTVASEGESITFQWMDAGAQWDDLQKSDELKDLITKSNGNLAEAGQRRWGRAKLQDALRLAGDSSVRVRFHPGRSREEDVALPFLMWFSRPCM